VTSKYAKYSTEQLEVILTHLSDPEDKELVKKELSQRYYNHYFGIINTPEGLPASGASAPEAAPEEINPATGDQAEADLAEDRELADLAEIAPIKLTLPVGPEPDSVLAAKPSGKTAKKKYCFIATAAYGSPLAREVVLLQNYRDNYLSRNPLGEKFIRAYYRFSPYFARQVSRSTSLRLLTRCLLTPLILLIKIFTDNPADQRIYPKK
jgi:hypothetical protein